MTGFYAMARFARQKGRGQHAAIKEEEWRSGHINICAVIGQCGAVWLYYWCFHWSESGSTVQVNRGSSSKQQYKWSKQSVWATSNDEWGSQDPPLFPGLPDMHRGLSFHISSSTLKDLIPFKTCHLNKID